jgi:hypothetical protein
LEKAIAAAAAAVCRSLDFIALTGDLDRIATAVEGRLGEELERIGAPFRLLTLRFQQLAAADQELARAATESEKERRKAIASAQALEANLEQLRTRLKISEEEHASTMARIGQEHEAALVQERKRYQLELEHERQRLTVKQDEAALATQPGGTLALYPAPVFDLEREKVIAAGDSRKMIEGLFRQFLAAAQQAGFHAGQLDALYAIAQNQFNVNLTRPKDLLGKVLADEPLAGLPAPDSVRDPKTDQHPAADRAADAQTPARGTPAPDTDGRNTMDGSTTPGEA